jgi:hypothetical protein
MLMSVAQAVDATVFGSRDASCLPPVATVLVQVTQAIEVPRASRQLARFVTARTAMLVQVPDAI